ncbi:hypothetical protein STENM327S_05580 [Streptomyces tendae]
MGRLWVTTVSEASGGIAAAMRATVEPASRIMVPSAGSSARAALAMRSFSSAAVDSRSARSGSKSSRPAGIAPPCTRRSRPARSRALRSRRMVSAVTWNSSASDTTSTRPPSRASRRISCCRSGAYMTVHLRPVPEPVVSLGGYAWLSGM